MVNFVTFAKKTVLLITLCAIIYLSFLVVRREKNTGTKMFGTGADLVKYADQRRSCNDTVTAVFVACKGDSVELLNSFERQKLQLMAAIKSVVYLTQRQIRFIIFGETRDVFAEILGIVSGWPAAYQAKVSFQFAQVEYPAKFEYVKNLFRPCSTMRLFLPNLLVDEDAVVYIDSDVILLRPLEEYWDNFDLFDNRQLAGAAAYVGGYRKRPQHLRYGTDGFNAGLMLFNLTRMRQFPAGWEDTVFLVLDRFPTKLSNGDQDVLNILFSANPSYFHLLGCEWNFRDLYCLQTHLRTCPKLSGGGAKAVHGTAGSFYKDGKFRSFFQTWADFNISLPIVELSKQLEINLATNQNEGKCPKFKKIDFVMRNQLELQLKTRYHT